MVNASGTTSKRSYTIPCATSFRDAVLNLGRRRGCNAGDLARSVVLTVPPDAIAAYPDPGEPDRKDRETIILKSGTAKGRPWRRKPRLQVRMAPGFGTETIRRALAIAVDLDAGKCAVSLSGAGLPAAPDTVAAQEERDRLRATISVLSFTPLSGGVQNRNDALYVLGFAPGQNPDQHTVRARFRMLATIHHPDGEFGDHERMAQLNEAVDWLRRGGL